MEDILANVRVAQCDLGSSWNILQSAAPELSSLEEDVGILIAAVVDQGNDHVKARTVSLL